MTEQKVFITNKEGEKLVGLKATPDLEQEEYPTAILVHGFGVTKEEYGLFDGLTKNLTDAGIMVFRFDFSGCGESEGDYSQTSLTKLGEELKEIINYVKADDQVDLNKIGLVGQSLGTSTIISIKPQVQVIALTGSINSPKPGFIKKFGAGYNPEGMSQVERSDGRITKMGAQFFSDFDNYNLLESITKINCPILFIHGAKDNKVSPDQTEEYYKNYSGVKEKIILDEADHDLEPQREEVYKLIANWFKKYL